MRLARFFAATCVASLALGFLACSDDENANPNRRRGETGGDAGLVIPGGELPDEQFPAYLLEPYTGPPIDYYDNTALGYVQLKARMKRVFADEGIGGNTDIYLASKIQLLGGADFTTSYTEARVIGTDFLLALDGIAKDACARAAQNKTGPFAGADPATDAPGGVNGLVGLLHERILLRKATPQEVTDTAAFVGRLVPLSTNKVEAWAGVCEALMRHPDAVFTLPPSVKTLTGDDKERLQLVKLAYDFAGRPATEDEMSQLKGKTINEKVDFYVRLPEFRAYYFNKTRIRMESVGTAESDEAANLWTYLAVTGGPFQELLTADYTVNANLERVGRPAEHGKSGVLTMPGFIKSKPGLPHYNYPARIMTDFMGQIFEVPQEIVDMRVTGTAASTVDPTSKCIACHGVLTPLAHQRLKWKDDGTYRTTDESGQPIDDSDRNMVPDYPYKGAGMAGFAERAVKKERFIRQTFQSQFLFFLGRQMRYDLDERTVYLALWMNAFEKKGDFRELLKIIANLPSYLGQ